jgi:hypothetical protein
MLSRKPLAFLACLALFATLGLSPVTAETVIKFDLADVSGADVSYNSGLLTTIDDGNPAAVGDQSTGIQYQGFLSQFANIASGGSLTLNGITANGSAASAGGLISQLTSGGTFSLFDNTNMLLLAGNLSSGVILGSSASTTGSFFSTSPVNYTGGSLLNLIQPNSGTISLSFTDVRTGGTAGMAVENNTLLNFTAAATGQLEASAVPEPSVFGMAAIGALALIRKHRRKRTASAK